MTVFEKVFNRIRLMVRFHGSKVMLKVLEFLSFWDRLDLQLVNKEFYRLVPKTITSVPTMKPWSLLLRYVFEEETDIWSSDTADERSVAKSVDFDRLILTHFKIPLTV